MPFVCSVVNIPDLLFDEDGGDLLWVSSDKLDTLKMPLGYLDTINNKIPRKSVSLFQGKYLKIIPNYIENDYQVIVRVRDSNNNLVIEKALNNFIAPRDFITEYTGSIKMSPQPTTFIDTKVYINYLYLEG